jgi:hypothetical protein
MRSGERWGCTSLRSRFAITVRARCWWPSGTSLRSSFVEVGAGRYPSSLLILGDRVAAAIGFDNLVELLDARVVELASQ